MSALPTIDDLEVAGRTVLVRADLNVPLSDGAVGDDFRIRAAVPTIAELRRRGARVVVCSHLGRPNGPDPAFSMRPVGSALAEIGGFPVVVAPDVGGPGATETVRQAGNSVVLLENTRFEPGETSNAPELADRLAAVADAFVLDAFGSAHRAHASTVGVAERLPSAAGTLLLAEVAAFNRIIEEPARPFVVLLGGAKISDKLGVVRKLLPRVDVMLIGGAMCFTLLSAEGYEVGDSLVEEDMVDEVAEVLASAEGSRIALPLDIVVGEGFAADTAHRIEPAGDLSSHGMGLDIGPETAERFAAIIAGADTIFWNGPMGVFEWEVFSAGTRRVAEAIGAARAYSVVGGGDSVAALRSMGLADSVSHLSTGGGAGLELIEKGSLPGLDALRGTHGS
ncbi:MAG: phosphoglycerate kinase [Actinobacteria bacterium RBG_16_68_21]|nr:MAG: phosphoglycerate kinase [Actinobacteria bacterium RBG_16_68_21]